VGHVVSPATAGSSSTRSALTALAGGAQFNLTGMPTVESVQPHAADGTAQPPSQAPSDREDGPSVLGVD
jgi:hypothetical protein